MTAVHVDPGNGANIIFGTAGEFKLNVCALANRKRGKGTVLHLGSKPKTEISSVTANFILHNYGADLLAGEFKFVAPSELLTLISLEDLVGILPHPDGGNGIPLLAEFHDEHSVSTFPSVGVPVVEE